jgi:hypothetical protein
MNLFWDESQLSADAIRYAGFKLKMSASGSAQFALPARELKFDGQALHVMLDEAPNAVE